MSDHETLVATAYVQIRRHEPYWGRHEARAMRVTQKRPDVVEPGCIVVKVKIRIPSAAWDPFEPEAVVDVPAHLIQHPIEVTADAAGED